MHISGNARICTPALAASETNALIRARLYALSLGRCVNWTAPARIVVREAVAGILVLYPRDFVSVHPPPANCNPTHESLRILTNHSSAGQGPSDKDKPFVCIR